MPVYLSAQNILEVKNREELSKIASENKEYFNILSKLQNIDEKYNTLFEENSKKEDKEAQVYWDKAFKTKEISEEEYNKISRQIHKKYNLSSILKKWDTEKADLEIKAKEVLTEILKKQGYDGVHIKNDKGSFGRTVETTIVFNNNQIKSVNNRGTYSPDIGNIYYQSKITDLFKPVVNEVKKFRNKVRDAFNGKLSNYSQITVLDNTPKVFTKIGLQDKPVRISYGVLKKINIEKHNVPMNVIEDLPNLISDPVAIFKSKTDENSYVAVLDAKDNSDRIIVSIMKSTNGNYNVIPSVYGKDNFENFIINNLKENNLLYINENKADVIRPSSLQLLGVYNTNLSNNNYITKEDIVNTNITTTEDTILNQNANGFFDSELKAIVLGSDFNFGTLPHEMAHFFLDKNFKIWKQGNAPEKFMKDFNAIANILGIRPGQESLTRDQQEMYANMTEAYLFGKGVPQGTEVTLKTYWDWCPPQYNNILDIGFRDSEGKIQNPILTKDIMEYFDNMYSQLALIDSPYSQSLNNPTTNKGDKIPANKDERIERNNNINENMIQNLKDIMQPDTPAEAIAKTKAQNSFIDPIDNYIDEVSNHKENKKNTSFTEKIQQLLPGRGRNTREQMELSAQKYIEKNKEHALEVAFGSPVDDLSMTSEFVYNDTGIERAVLIREVMKLYSENSTEWSMLYHNFAVYRSEQGKAAGLTNDINTQLYMSGYARLVNLLETKAAAIRYGKGNDSVERFNADVDKFVASWVDTILNTEPESKARDIALNNFLENAKAEFGTDEATHLLQEDISKMKRAKKGQKKSFEDIARRKVKQLANAIPSDIDINQLMLLAREAQMQLRNIDSNNVDEAIAAGKAIRNFQEYISQKGLDDSFFQKLIGAYAPRAMLSRPSTHLANIVSNSVEMYTVKSGLRLHYGKNIVSKNLIKAESERLSEIYKNTGFNLAQQYTVNDTALLHGEKYRTKPAAEIKGIGKLDPLKLLGDSDFTFRKELYLDALASICSKQANGDVSKANELFNEYKQLGTLNEDALKARKEALLVANIGVFTQDGTFARILTQIRNSLDLINIDYNNGKFAFGVKGGKGLGTLLAPFIKTPANIIELGARAIASPITSLVALKNSTYNIHNTIDLANLSMSLLIFGIVSALGMGGGTILILLLGIFTNLEQHLVQGTNLIVFIPVSIIAILINIKNKSCLT